jgi:putative endopeptidase
MIRVIALSLASTALAACAAQTGQTPAAATPVAPVAAQAPAAPSAPKPQYGAFGFDSAGMDTSVAPWNDFFDYANGTWAKNTPIPPTLARSFG